MSIKTSEASARRNQEVENGAFLSQITHTVLITLQNVVDLPLVFSINQEVVPLNEFKFFSPKKVSNDPLTVHLSVDVGRIVRMNDYDAVQRYFNVAVSRF